MNDGIGHDTRHGGSGNQEILGGVGTDVADLTDIARGITLVSTGTGSYTSTNESASNTIEIYLFFEILKVIGSNFNDLMTGGDGDNVFDDGFVTRSLGASVQFTLNAATLADSSSNFVALNSGTYAHVCHSAARPS